MTTTTARLHATEQVPGGDGRAPLVALVHGSMSRSAVMAPVANRLADLHVLLYDRRGYHRSREAGVGTRLQQHVEDLLDLLGGRPAVAAGHSYGGLVALAAAAAAPEVVGSVLAYEPPLFWLAGWPEDSAGRVALQAAGKTGDPGAAAEAFLRRVLSDEGFERLPPEVRAERRLEGPALVAELGELRSGGAPFPPERIQVPVILACGTATASYRRPGLARLAQAIPAARLELVEGAGHDAPITHPDAFAGLVRRAVVLAGADPR
jgi:pimeloyl-ACP methyl ester carboxylesterase